MSPAANSFAQKLLHDVKRMLNTGVFHVLITVVGSRGIIFVQQALLTRILSPAIFGQAVYLIRLVSVLWLFASLGVPAAVLKYAAEPGSYEDRCDIYRTGLVTSIMTSLTFAGLYAVGIIVLDCVVGLELRDEMLFLGLFLPLRAISLIPVYYLQASKLIRKASMLSLVSNIFRVVIVVLLAYLAGLWGYLVAFTAGVGIEVAIFLVYTRKDLSIGRVIKDGLPRKLLRFGGFSSMANFSGAINASVSVFLLKWMGYADEKIAAFGIALMIMMTVRMLPQSLMRTSFPYMSSHRGSPDVLAKKVKELSVKQTVVLLLMFSGVIVFGRWLLVLLFGTFYEASYVPLLWLFVSMMFWGAGAPYGSGMLVMDCVRANTLISTLQLVVNVAIAIPLIKVFGPNGAAAAYALSAVVLVVGNVSMFQWIVRSQRVKGTDLA